MSGNKPNTSSTLNNWFQTQLTLMTDSNIQQPYIAEDLERVQRQKDQRLIEALKVMDPNNSAFKKLQYMLHNYGWRFALECALRYLGMNIDSTIRYPIKDSKIKMGQDAPIWKLRLETDKWDELSCLRFLSDVVKEGDTILDVGAHHGTYTLFFAKCASDKGHVHAFEPDPKAVHKLIKNVKKNGLTNVQVEEIALYDAVGEFTIKCREMGDSGASLLPGIYANESNVNEFTVATTTIDKYCEDKGIVPDGIKIDVEGAEASVIKGGLNVIKKFNPWVILEFHSCYMSERDLQENWKSIITHAKKVVFLSGYSLRFHVFIQY